MSISTTDRFTPPLDLPTFVASSVSPRQQFAALENETRSHVETACGAFHLNRKEQTLRAWACLENGPIRPIRINGRLAWSVAEIKRLLDGGA